jgi:hypothetical protein
MRGIEWHKKTRSNPISEMDGAEQCQMSKLKVQMKSKGQMTNFEKKNLLASSHLAFL